MQPETSHHDPTPASGLSEALGHAASDKRLEVLRRVGESGSISQAARDAGISYKAAWQAIDTLPNLGGVPLVERTVSGWGWRARNAVLARFAGGAQWVRVEALSVAGCAYVGWHTDSPVPERCNGSPKSADSDTGFGS